MLWSEVCVVLGWLDKLYFGMVDSFFLFHICVFGLGEVCNLECAQTSTLIGDLDLTQTVSGCNALCCLAHT